MTHSKVQQLFSVSKESISKMRFAMVNEIKLGLQSQPSSLDCVITYAWPPSGKEKGQFLAIDLGGTNLRVKRVRLDGSKKAPVIENIIQQKLSKTDITTTTAHLMDIIAELVKKMVKDIPGETTIPVGFTFSFPMIQTGLNKGALNRWTKGFSMPDGVGQDMVNMLNEAFHRKGLTRTTVQAIINDTTGTVLAGAYVDDYCDVGMILGTGTNICLKLPTNSIQKLSTSFKHPDMYINLESGNFNKELPTTQYDMELDSTSTNRGEQLVEKMISAKYLGEIVSLIVADYINKGTLFSDLSGNEQSEFLALFKSSFKTEHMSEIEEADHTQDIRGIFQRLDSPNMSDSDCSIILDIVKAVAKRSAHIASALIAGVIQTMDPGLDIRHVIGIDGSLFEKYPGYSNHIKYSLSEQFGLKKSQLIELVLTKDGSGVGAAIASSLSAI